jgi:hypothetical protein
MTFECHPHSLITAAAIYRQYLCYKFKMQILLPVMGSLLTNDGRCTREIKFRIAMAKSAFNKNTFLPAN